ncbi:ER degradation-enhancing alpha-mannosidase-like protein 3 [Homalodisca vitripennis]|nr:ER degradation-enhancing alpha-mannosidase-like protein 3 [Homalodisca vitripennis]
MVTICNNHPLIWRSLCCIVLIIKTIQCLEDPTSTQKSMTKEEKNDLKEEARDMFYHAYRAYMENAYPADELMPLSCAGRYRGSHASRGDIDDTLGNFSLTLIDSLDTLAVLGDLAEFEHAAKLITQDVSFDSDVVVSVFETNIRVLGGLLSGHILAEYFQERAGVLRWYRGQLLHLAKDIGYRLLPAFNTTTGIPHARVNLRYGLKSQKLEWSQETCTACAGTMVLEMAALSRLTGEHIFEEKAHRAMDELWKLRHRSSDLMGTVLNVQSGTWVRRDSGVGAGIDSYYEYCLKAYILLGEDRYLSRFNKHYSAVMKYISQGPMLLDVHMHKPHTNSRNFMDALLAFWPGLQVLKGDLKPAVETHEMLYQVMQRHNFIPEAFTTDFQVHWGQHPLRPEFLESTYFLYRATKDPHYLYVGRDILRALQTYARVPCGYAAVKDVRTNHHEDRMDSFVLAETLKYLYLLFAEDSDLLLNLDEFLFTTEAHLLPLTLARNQANLSFFSVGDELSIDDSEWADQCPSHIRLFPASVRHPLRNMVKGSCPRSVDAKPRKLTASQFQASNEEHMRLVKEMGITVQILNDGRVQLLHTFSNAKSVSDAEEGLVFMAEMVELSKAQNVDTVPQTVRYSSQGETVTLSAGPAHFGKQLTSSDQISGKVGVANPLRACQPLTNAEWLQGRIAIVERGDCMFIEKARKLQQAGAVGSIVVDNAPGSAATTSPMFAMSGDGTDDVDIPVVFLFSLDAWQLLQALAQDPTMVVTLSGNPSEEVEQSNNSVESEDEALLKIKKSIQEFLSTQDQTKNVGKSEVTMVDVGDLSNGQDMIKISRRNAYLSSEGTAVVPPTSPTRETLRAILLDIFSKPHPAQKDQDDIVQVKSRNRMVLKQPDEL